MAKCSLHYYRYGTLMLSASWTQLQVGLMACTASSPQGKELLSSPGVAGEKKSEALLFLEGEHPPHVEVDTVPSLHGVANRIKCPASWWHP